MIKTAYFEFIWPTSILKLAHGVLILNHESQENLRWLYNSHSSRNKSLGVHNRWNGAAKDREDLQTEQSKSRTATATVKVATHSLTHSLTRPVGKPTVLSGKMVMAPVLMLTVGLWAVATYRAIAFSNLSRIWVPLNQRCSSVAWRWDVI